MRTYGNTCFIVVYRLSMFTCIVFFHVYPSCIFGGCSRQRNNGNQEIKKFLDSSSFKFKEKEAWQTANEVDSCLIRRGSDGQCMLHRAMWTCIWNGKSETSWWMSQLDLSDFFNDALFYNIIYDYALLCICFHVGDWNSLLVIDVVRFMLFQMLFRQ